MRPLVNHTYHISTYLSPAYMRFTVAPQLRALLKAVPYVDDISKVMFGWLKENTIANVST